MTAPKRRVVLVLKAPRRDVDRAMTAKLTTVPTRPKRDMTSEFLKKRWVWEDRENFLGGVSGDPATTKEDAVARSPACACSSLDRI